VAGREEATESRSERQQRGTEREGKEARWEIGGRGPNCRGNADECEYKGVAEKAVCKNKNMKTKGQTNRRCKLNPFSGRNFES
jgi:hypothetical protein